MTGANKNISVAGAGCILVIASLCLITIGAPQRGDKDRRKRPQRRDVALKIGQMAPDFELYTLEHALAMQS